MKGFNVFKRDGVKMTRYTRLSDSLRVYVIADVQMVSRTRLVEQVEGALKGGATALQLRMKGGSVREVLTLGERLRILCEKADALFIVNDRVDLAQALRADGVHLGADDMPIAWAREILGPSFVIGATAKTVSQGRSRLQAGADYLGIGPVYPSSTKPAAGPVLGVNRFQEMVEGVSAPVVGIGGITPGNVTEVMHAGSVGVAVVSCVMKADNAYDVTQKLRAKVEEALK